MIRPLVALDDTPPPHEPNDPRQGPYCPPDKDYEVVDAKTLYVNEKGVNVTWTEGQDHAKWGVALDGSGLLCVGDINRMRSQRDRGGGAVCFQNRKLSVSMVRCLHAVPPRPVFHKSARMGPRHAQEPAPVCAPAPQYNTVLTSGTCEQASKGAAKKIKAGA